MLRIHSPRCQRHRMLGRALGITATGLLASGVADAHFHLDAPTSFMMQSTDGTPQKMPPCGNEAPQTPSNAVTPFRPGDTVTIRLTETVFHPGHYRVALAVNSPSELPPEPTVTRADTACGSVPIDPNPAFPVLVDGALVHTAPLSGQQTISVKLPTNVTCTKCTLQVIEFMGKHGLNVPGGCFYHHCANISIQGASVDGGPGTDASKDGSSAGDANDAGGGATGGGGGAAGALGTAGAGGVGGDSPGSGGASGVGSGSSTTTVGGTSGSNGSAGSGGSTEVGGANGASTPGADAGCSCAVPSRSAGSLAGFGALAGLLLAFRKRRSHLRRHPGN
jgi:MYXO-CTERM domain-containing protein